MKSQLTLELIRHDTAKDAVPVGISVLLPMPLFQMSWRCPCLWRSVQHFMLLGRCYGAAFAVSVVGWVTDVDGVFPDGNGRLRHWRLDFSCCS